MFEYIYGKEDCRCQFFKVPLMLFTNEILAGLSNEAKLLYGLLLDRTGLSIMNDWTDEDGRVYVNYTNAEVCRMLKIGAQKAVKIFRELASIGLIERIRVGLGRPDRIFVKHIATEQPCKPEPIVEEANSNVLILGNSGQGKSYLTKLLLCNQREAGKSILCLDPEHEYEDLCRNLGGTYIDMMSGEYMINPLEPKSWGEADRSEDAPETFRRVTRLSQHISYLKDFFRAYKDFTDAEIDCIEIMLMKLYARFGIDDSTDFSRFTAEDFPTVSDLYDLTEKEFMSYDREKKNLYTEDMLQNICLGLHSMCKGAESKYFNGHTNIRDGEFICFGVKGLMDSNKKLKDTLLFNILSFMSNQLLGKGNTVAAVDELYLFLTNMTAIEYIRNGMKRVRKKESSFILASQNLEDFLLPEIKEFTKPLFSIPSHQFLFFPGNISPAEFIDILQLEESEFCLIHYPERGTCLYRCGNERYLLQVMAPDYKAVLFGNAGGR